MKKIERWFKVDYDLGWEYDGAISKIKKDIEELEKLGATHVEIDEETSFGESSIRIRAFSERMETDEEYQERIDEESKKEEEIKRRDLAKLEEIKSKYNL
jgi:hypothetical protein